MSKSEKKKILASNRKAYHRFHILETLEAGIVLTGAETKSAKGGHVALVDSYAVLKNGEAWLLNCHIAPYAYDTSRSAEPARTRKLLLKKVEIERVMGKIQAKGLTAVPLEVYVNEKGRVKLSLALCKGKTGIDRRDDIKRRDIDREMAGKYKIK
ncbi:MAG: SsrA-binding protein SmpB [Elusimicrobia bacterium]|nr:SsrA-binding protein SmpB [Elusimicrobiota bacterium]